MTDSSSENKSPIDPTKVRQTLEYKHDRPLVACRYHPSGDSIVFGAEDNLIHRYDIAAKSITPFAAHDSWIRALGFSPDGSTLYSGGYDGRLIFWPATAEKPEPARTVAAHQGWLRALAISPSGDRLATCGNDNLVKLWNAADGQSIAECRGHDHHVYNVAFHPSSETLVSCDLKGNLKEWNAQSGEPTRELSAAAPLYKYDTTFRADIGGARSLAFSSEGKQLALGGITSVTNAFAGIGNPAIVLIDMADGKVIRQLEAQQKLNGVAWGVTWHPAGFWIGLAGGGGGGWLYFFKPDATNEFFKLKLPSDGRDLALSPDGTQVAVAHADKTLRLYALHA
jgi:WD40 repeat protein